MTRWTDAALKTALQEQRASVVLFLRLVFSTTTFRLTTHPAASGLPFAWTPPGESSQDWVNVGGLLQLDVPHETGVEQAAATQLRIVLTATDGLISAALNEHYQNREAAIFAAMLDEDGDPISPGMLLFKGLMNGGWTLAESRAPDGSADRIATGLAVSRIAELQEIRGLTTSPYVHKLAFSGDAFFEFVAYNVNRRIRVRR